MCTFLILLLVDTFAVFLQVYTSVTGLPTGVHIGHRSSYTCAHRSPVFLQVYISVFLQVYTLVTGLPAVYTSVTGRPTVKLDTIRKKKKKEEEDYLNTINPKSSTLTVIILHISVAPTDSKMIHSPAPVCLHRQMQKRERTRDNV